MAFSKVPRIDMEHEDPAVRRILDYLVKQQDELEYKFMNLDSDNVYQIDFAITEAKNLELPEMPENVITEVIHQQVINVETAHILNAWIKNLFVEYLETNFDALVWGNPETTRNYIRIINEQITFYTDTLSTTEYEPLLIPNPNGSNTMVNVFYTAIGDHPDAYKYFTITDPRLIHPEMTGAEVEAFKVLVKKTIKSSVKKSILFNQVKTESGISTVMPINVEGEGSDLTNPFGERRGQFVDYKSPEGKIFKQYCEDNDDFVGIRMHPRNGLEQWSWQLQKWIPLGANAVGGLGGIMFWKDKTTFTSDMLQGANILHYGYNSASADVVNGQYSTLFKPSALTFLGGEVATILPPIVPVLPDGFALPKNLKTCGAKYYWAFVIKKAEGQYIQGILIGKSREITTMQPTQFVAYNSFFVYEANIYSTPNHYFDNQQFNNSFSTTIANDNTGGGSWVNSISYRGWPFIACYTNNKSWCEYYKDKVGYPITFIEIY